MGPSHAIARAYCRHAGPSHHLSARPRRECYTRDEIGGSVTGVYPVNRDDGVSVRFIVKLDTGNVVNVKVEKTVPFLKGRRVIVREVEGTGYKSYRFVRYAQSTGR